MGETAVIKYDADGEYYLNDAAAALMFGVTLDVLERHVSSEGGRTSHLIPETLRRSGIRRRKEYEAAVGMEEPDFGETLIYYARIDGVELVYEDAAGARTVVVPKPFWRKEGGDTPAS
ncbi:hypothetical protein [Gordonia sputi]